MYSGMMLYNAQILLVWGNDKAGLKKILRKHLEVVDNLQGILDEKHVTMHSENRIQLERDEYQAAVRLTWNGEEKL